MIRPSEMVKAKVSILLMSQGKIIIRPSYLKVVKEVSILLMSHGKIIMIIIRPSYLKMVKEVSILLMSQGKIVSYFKMVKVLILMGQGKMDHPAHFKVLFFCFYFVFNLK